jgi:hypothetical protein
MSWGPTLSQALKANESAVIKSAERLAQRKPLAAPEMVFRTLVACAAGKGSGSAWHLARGVGSHRRSHSAQGGIWPKPHRPEATARQRGHAEGVREELKDWAEAWLRKRLEGP